MLLWAAQLLKLTCVLLFVLLHALTRSLTRTRVVRDCSPLRTVLGVVFGFDRRERAACGVGARFASAWACSACAGALMA